MIMTFDGDDDVDAPKVEGKDAPPTSVSSSAGLLGSLACAYASSDEDGNDDAETGDAGEMKEAEMADQTDDIAKDPKCATEVNANDSNEPTRKRKKNRKRNKKSGDQPEVVQRLLTDGQVKYQLTKKRQKRDPTLLERLLAPEVRRERNIILQCVRYIVRKDFFDGNA